jgi:hypothetical protein
MAGLLCIYDQLVLAADRPPPELTAEGFERIILDCPWATTVRAGKNRQVAELELMLIVLPGRLQTRSLLEYYSTYILEVKRYVETPYFTGFFSSKAKIPSCLIRSL